MSRSTAGTNTHNSVALDSTFTGPLTEEDMVGRVEDECCEAAGRCATVPTILTAHFLSFTVPKFSTGCTARLVGAFCERVALVAAKGAALDGAREDAFDEAGDFTPLGDTGGLVEYRERSMAAGG